MLEPTSINLFFLTIFLIEFLASLDIRYIPFVNLPDDLPCPEYSIAKKPNLFFTAYFLGYFFSINIRHKTRRKQYKDFL